MFVCSNLQVFLATGECFHIASCSMFCLSYVVPWFVSEFYTLFYRQRARLLARWEHNWRDAMLPADVQYFSSFWSCSIQVCSFLTLFSYLMFGEFVKHTIPQQNLTLATWYEKMCLTFVKFRYCFFVALEDSALICCVVRNMSYESRWAFIQSWTTCMWRLSKEASCNCSLP